MKLRTIAQDLKHLSKSPRSAKAVFSNRHAIRGDLYNRRKQWKRAIAEWEQAHAKAPHDPYVALGYVTALKHTGATQEAEQILLAFTEVRLNDRVLMQLSEFAQMRGDFDLAREYVVQAHDAQLRTYAPFLGFVETYPAIADLIPAMERQLNGKVPLGRSVNRLARCLEQVGRSEEAFELYARVFRESGFVHSFIAMMRTYWDAKGMESALPEWAQRFGWYDRRQRYLDSRKWRAAQPKAPRTSGPTRVLFVSRNWSFMRGIVEDLANDSRFDIQTLEPPQLNQEVLSQIDRTGDATLSILDKFEKEHPIDAKLLRWADVVFCEWSAQEAVWLSRALPPQTKLVIRLHSFEAFTPWPVMIDWGRVDSLIFVADHIRAYLEESLHLTDLGVSISVIPPTHDVGAFSLPKTEDARWTLGMIGYGTANKDPIMALEILRRVREKEPRFKMRLLGHAFNPTLGSYRDWQYFRRFRQALEAGGLEDSVQLDGFTDDVPSWLTHVGFILSTSIREGTHEAIAQGMSSGAVPLVRRWSLFRRWKGTETRYPNAILFDEVEEAAQRILEIAGDDDHRRKLSASAKKESMDRFTVDRIHPALKKLLARTP